MSQWILESWEKNLTDEEFNAVESDEDFKALSPEKKIEFDEMFKAKTGEPLSLKVFREGISELAKIFDDCPNAKTLESWYKYCRPVLTSGMFVKCVAYVILHHDRRGFPMISAFMKAKGELLRSGLGEDGQLRVAI